MLNAIQHAVSIANYWICQQAQLDSDQKFVIWGELIIIFLKFWFLFVCCLSVFFGVLEAWKIRSPAQNKKYEKLGEKPLNWTPYQ